MEIIKKTEQQKLKFIYRIILIISHYIHKS